MSERQSLAQRQANPVLLEFKCILPTKKLSWVVRKDSYSFTVGALLRSFCPRQWSSWFLGPVSLLRSKSWYQLASFLWIDACLNGSSRRHKVQQCLDSPLCQLVLQFFLSRLKVGFHSFYRNLRCWTIMLAQSWFELNCYVGGVGRLKDPLERGLDW